MSLLAALRLTGVLHEPLTPEIVVVEAVAWNMSRSSYYTTINEEIRNSHSDNIATINLVVHIKEYEENDSLRGDNLELTVTATANLSEGFIRSMDVRFSRTDEYALLNTPRDPDWIKFDGLKMVEIISWATSEHEAYLATVAPNQTRFCSLKIGVWWMFLDENSVDHGVTVTLEATYFNGTALHKVMMPIELGVMAT
jgi:hypothetical protein